MSPPPETRPLGLLGGTFDPVHFGHLRLAEEALDALGLPQLVWIPAGRPPHREAPCAEAAHRLAMVRLAVAGNPRFALDEAEIRAEAPSYTVLTLERLRAARGARPLVLVLGADAFLGLEGWHRWRELFELAHIAVATRPGFALNEAPMGTALATECAARCTQEAGVLKAAPAGRILPFTMTPLAISASLVRARLAAGASVRYLLPDPVREYIDSNHLYGAGPHR
jgi:nicotinate-nucleotide adenylyltransferase